MNKNKEYFNQLADRWDLIVNHDKKRIKTILEITNLQENKRILDIATGTGVLINFLSEFNPKEILAIDISPNMIKKALKKFNDSNLTFLVKDFYDLEQKDFDYIICYSAYPHFLEKKLFAKKMYSVLKPNGRFVIAHSESKSKINNRHSSTLIKSISRPLKNVLEEAEVFRDFFSIDILVDTDEYYIISGKKPI